jgi:ABC-type transport system substrate-binding protein
VANENYRGGRPFVDSIAIQMGRTSRDRLLDLELNKTDLAEIPVEQVRLAIERGVRVSESKPDQLLAVIFVSRDCSPQKDGRVCEGFSRAIDRAAIVNFILQKQGEPAGGLLPQWSSGAAFLFSTETGGTKSPGELGDMWQQIGGSPKIVLGYDSGDTLEQAIAERISVNVREAGIFVTTEAIPADSRGVHDAPATIDARLIRWKMPSPDARESLVELLNEYEGFGATDFEIPEGASAQQMYETELAAVNSFKVVPLAWIPRAYGVSARVRDWSAPAPGEVLPLADVWLDGEAP